MICLVLVICVLLSCESETVNKPDGNEFQYVGSNFQFEVKDEKPLVKLSGDTLVGYKKLLCPLNPNPLNLREKKLSL